MLIVNPLIRSVCASVLMLVASNASGQTVVTWTGAAFNGNYSDPMNWDPPIAPINNGTDQFEVVIPSNVTVHVDPAMNSAFSVDALSLASDSILVLANGRRMTVNDGSQISGFIQSTIRSELVVTNSSDQIRGAMFRTSSAGTIRFTATQYSTVDADSRFGGGFESFETDGLIDLSSVEEFHFEPQPFDQDIPVIARFGGRIDLSGLTSIDAQTDDRVLFEAEGTRSVIDLDSLRTIDTGGARFSVESGGAIDLSGLNDLDGAEEIVFSALNNNDSVLDLTGLTSLGSGERRTISAYNARVDASSLTSVGLGTVRSLSADGTGILDVSSLESLGNTRVRVSAAAQLLAGSATSAVGATLSADEGGLLTLPALTHYSTGDQFAIQFSGDVNIFEAEDPESTLDVSNLNTLEFGDTSNRKHNYTVEATNAGLVDLSRLESIVQHGNDALEFLATEQGSRIVLGTMSSLESEFLSISAREGGAIDASQILTLNNAEGEITAYGQDSHIDISGLTSIGAGNKVGLSARDNGTIDASQLTSLGAADTPNIFNAYDGGHLDLSSLAALDTSRLEIRNGGTILADKIATANGSSIQVNGNNSSLAMPSLTTFTTGIPPFIQGTSIEVIRVSGEHSKLDLSNLETLRFGSAENGRDIEVVAAGALLDLSSLTNLVPIDNETLDFIAEGEGGKILIGSINTPIFADIGFVADRGAEVHLQSLSLTAGNALVAVEGGALKIANDLSIADGFVRVNNESTLAIGGSFGNNSMNEGRYSTEEGTIQITGDASTRAQYFEIASEDAGAGAGSEYNDGNFGIGHLVVGEFSQRVLLSLTDAIDNDNRLNDAAESLYLFGTNGEDGLSILGGSTLNIGDYNVYASLDGTMTNLQDLFINDQRILSFGDGFIAIPAPAPAISLTLSSLLVASRKRSRLF